MIFDVIQPPNWYPAARKISVIDSIDVHIYRLTPKKGVNILEARSSRDKTTAPVKNIKKENNIINNELSNALLGILSDNTSDNIFDLEIQSKKFTNVKTKDSKGNPFVYVLKLQTKIIAKDK